LAVLRLRSRGARVVRLYSTWQAEGLYLSLGFRPTAPRTVYRRLEENAPRRVRERQEADGHRVDTLSFGDLPELYGVDPGPTGGPVGPDLRHLETASGAGPHCPGFVGADKGIPAEQLLGGATRIGPFVASSPGVGRLLLACALGASDGSSVEVTVPGPAENPTHDLLHKFGFRGCKDRLRMELGEESGGRLSGLLELYGTTSYLAT
jgi:hypothetical protein